MRDSAFFRSGAGRDINNGLDLRNEKNLNVKIRSYLIARLCLNKILSRFKY